MTRFILDDSNFNALPGETVLAALRRHGAKVNYSCTKGQCRSCLLQHKAGPIPRQAQRGLEAGLKQAGLVLACQCPARDKLVLASLDHAFYQAAVIVDKQWLTDSVVRLVLKPGTPLHFRAGQCLSLLVPGMFSRTYGIASRENAETLTLHIRRKHNGKLSHWLFHEAKVGEQLQLSQPWGECCYRAEFVEDELIVVAGGTGIGPAAAIVEEAMASGHRGKIYLYHHGRNLEDLYLHRELLRRMLERRELHYQALISSRSEADRIDNNRVILAEPQDIVPARHSLERHQRLFILGEPAMVAAVREMAFLAALPMDRIHVMGFEYRDLRRSPR
ncbi:2Fe-2S iron-sulfur cluster-binding protein [Shewanella cyperi]|uniref:2Fe-2S iron-sulfur cluster-binding protein n=1 Tax=Shewanella cyperi TaxID=2814292 RepID=UPI001A952C6E|nr:2Fe-2S iron-sulfur cluster-binding protein [Shewanella cyperi]QSX42197.1 2Fe-2S iron-sulfur cluster binding domain-containing protein [Shewanella cyperi]